MVIDKIRMFVQAGSFLLLTYGGKDWDSSGIRYSLLRLSLCTGLRGLLFFNVFSASWLIWHCCI